MKKIIPFLLIILYACNYNDNNNGYVCPPEYIPTSPYDNPIWHPSGEIIGFNHIPLKEMILHDDRCVPVTYTYKTDSAGFWLINSDGTNQRRILSYTLITPSWSPDGKWIAFSQGAQICIMPFDGYQFDTTKIIQLTNEGRNFYPTWNYNMSKIAFDKSICDDKNICGIWIYDMISKELQNIAKYGMYPSWYPFSDTLIYLTNTIDNVGNDIGDSLWLYIYSSQKKCFLKFISNPNYDNRNVNYSPDGKNIAFTSSLSTGDGTQLFKISSNGSDFRKLTKEGCLNYSWSPDGRKIVYVNYDYSRIDEEKGTLWIMDSDGTNKKQLTRNIFKIIQ